jgi:hypothetical protein
MDFFHRPKNLNKLQAIFKQVLKGGLSERLWPVGRPRHLPPGHQAVPLLQVLKTKQERPFAL